MISAAWSHTQLRCSHFIESLHWSSTYCVNSIVTHSNSFVFNKLLNWVLPERIFLNASEYIWIHPSWMNLPECASSPHDQRHWMKIISNRKSKLNKQSDKAARATMRRCAYASYAFQCIPVYSNAFQCISIYSNVFQFWNIIWWACESPPM